MIIHQCGCTGPERRMTSQQIINSPDFLRDLGLPFLQVVTRVTWLTTRSKGFRHVVYIIYGVNNAAYMWFITILLRPIRENLKIDMATYVTFQQKDFIAVVYRLTSPNDQKVSDMSGHHKYRDENKSDLTETLTVQTEWCLVVPASGIQRH